MAQAVSDLFKSFAQVLGPNPTVTGTDLVQLVKQLFSVSAGLTAHAGGTQAAGLQLSAAINELAVVATAADSVLLPVGLPGQITIIINDGAASAQVFGVAANPQNGGVGDTIAAHGAVTQTATATGVAQASAAVGIYYCFALGKWKQTLLT